MPPVKIRFAYRKGFRRLWLVIALLWLALVAAGRWGRAAGDLSEFASSFLTIGVLPMLTLYIFGVICVWIIEGFARADR